VLLVGDSIKRHMDVSFDNMYDWEGIWEKEWGVNRTTNDNGETSRELPANAGSSLADFSTLKMDAIRSSEMSIHTRPTRRHYPCGGGVEYLHRDPASRRRRRNGTKKKAAP
jgi:hypothetical protein